MEGTPEKVEQPTWKRRSCEAGTPSPTAQRCATMDWRGAEAIVPPSPRVLAETSKAVDRSEMVMRCPSAPDGSEAVG